MRQTKKGPRTVMGTNPRGEDVWLSSQAPYGFIWQNEIKYWRSISQELEKVTFQGTTKREVTGELEKACERATEEMAITVSEAAPVDSGQLSDSFHSVASGNELLEEK